MLPPIFEKSVIGRSYIVERDDKQMLLFQNDDSDDFYTDWRFNKFPNTADKVFINNGNIINVSIPEELDKDWYITYVLDKLNREWGVDLNIRNII